MILLADCLISFGACMALTIIFSFPDSYALIVRHKQRIGWVGPGVFMAGLILVLAGVAIYMKEAA